MGCGDSKIAESNTHVVSDAPSESVTMSVNWKIAMSPGEAKVKYINDGTLSSSSSDGELELRALLEDPVARQCMRNYLESMHLGDVLDCWRDILDYRQTEQMQHLKNKAFFIYSRYIKSGAYVSEHYVEDDVVAKFDTLFKQEYIVAEFMPDMFDWLSNRCFAVMYDPVFLQFKMKSEYTRMNQLIRKKTNHVRHSDFAYIKCLGEGGFGMVAHVVKISTGKHYAMKIQTKLGMFMCFRDTPWRVDFEKQVFAVCKNPYIVELSYAFQTKTLAILVMSLGTSGDLANLLRQNGAGLPYKNVNFYAAEIVCALAYLHSKGLIYRDLKPSNVLINADGHIQLVDFGAVVDVNGRTLGLCHQENGNAAIFAAEYGRQNVSNHSVLEGMSAMGQSTFDLSGDREGGCDGVSLNPDEDFAPPMDTQVLKRATSVVGTYGYMAPEMVVLLTQPGYEQVGYSKAIDWWSLGVTIYRLLSNSHPFKEENMAQEIETANARMDVEYLKKYSLLFQDIDMLATRKPETTDEEHADVSDFIVKLLDVNETTRLGAGILGSFDVKNHKYFSNIEWRKVDAKELEPPCDMPSEPLSNEPYYTSLDAMLRECGHDSWLKNDKKLSKVQKHFEAWNYSSPTAIVGEYEAKGKALQQRSAEFSKQLPGSPK